MKTEKLLAELTEAINDYYFDPNKDCFDLSEGEVLANLEFYEKFFYANADVDSDGANVEAKIYQLIINYKNL